MSAGVGHSIVKLTTNTFVPLWGPLCIASWYPKFNGSHFGFPPVKNAFIHHSLLLYTHICTHIDTSPHILHGIHTHTHAHFLVAHKFHSHICMHIATYTYKFSMAYRPTYYPQKDFFYPVFSVSFSSWWSFLFFGMFCLVPLTFPCLDKLAVAFSFSSECRV